MRKFLRKTSAVCALFCGFLSLAACGIKREADIPSAEMTPPEVHIPEESPEIYEKPESQAPQETPQEVPQETPHHDKVQYVCVLTDGLNVRTGAGTGYSALGRAEKGTLLKYSGKSGNWYETAYRGRQAFVSADGRYSELITLDPADDKIEKVIAAGEKYLGTPYVYGAVRLHDGKGHLLKGFTTEKFDCSSLMQYIFYGQNVLLDVTTRTQINQGVHVAKEDIRRGDLLFFTNASRYSNTGIERVGHVALYLGGNYILHTASDYAKIEQITAQRQRYFLEARRML